MSDMLTRIVENMGDRITGPMHLRVFLQPVMAMIFATLDGLNDAKAGRPPYFWSLFTRPETRADMLRQGWKSIWKVFAIAAVLDCVYQYIEQKFIYWGEVFLVALLLAIVPYLILRGLVSRFAPKPKKPAL